MKTLNQLQIQLSPSRPQGRLTRLPARKPAATAARLRDRLLGTFEPARARIIQWNPFASRTLAPVPTRWFE